MRTRGINVQQILLGLALLAALVWNLAHAAEIRAVQLDSGPTGTRAELRVDREAEFRLISLQNPHRLVVDLPGSSLAARIALPPPEGVVKTVRSGKPEPGTTRIVFDLAAPVVALKPRYETGPQGTRLVIEWPGDGQGDPIAQIIAATTTVAPAQAETSSAPSAVAPAATAQDPAVASAAATSRLVAEMRATQAPATSQVSNPASPPQPQSTNDPSLPRAVPSTSPPAAPAVAATPAPPPPATRTITAGTRPLVIAIDAGHGGQDPGAIGPSGKREKDITLAIARELARQVNATPGLRAHLVRDKDVFIPLNNRARIARDAKADMFISIHADAAENRNAKGSSVYVLSLRGASSQRARWLADKENAADLIGGVRTSSNDNVLTSVLLDLTQSGQMKASEDAGNHILSGLKRIGNNHKPHIERANFAVLRTSDMPAMLVETAFLSNPDEEKRLIDPKFQGTVARAILDGVHTYFSSQPPPGTLYAARAAGDRVAMGGAGGSP
ncbi:AMIN domain-containing protein [Luteimonas marina]|uniref:N-acetylmuramoyl-L-alanine amidase AmiC n=1 Tax=Luteimonas marina TaxID=488485 RepID=A0A5C5UC91_9GAMM|nr:N-acetylmuramoyl-L-alanine amidase [Luteimonas marina]TWT23210.1 AMIN domain-containing protein [Luteimonas marina]